MIHRGSLYSRFLIALLAVIAAPPLWAAEAPPSFERDIAPLLRAHCLKCHSGTSPKGNLDLTQREAMLKGGKRGSALTPNKADESLLYEMVRDQKMPPKQPLDEAQLDALRRWIDAGAKWEGGIFWS